MDTPIAQNNPPHLHSDRAAPVGFSTLGRNYGVGLGLLTAVYLIIINLFMDNGVETGFGVPLGLRFAKHLIIIPIAWVAVSSYAKVLPEGRKFKSELGMLGYIAVWAAIVLAVINILFFAITGTSFEQFVQEGVSLMGVMINSGFLIFETIVFVMIIGFIILQAYKGGGSPED
jgi:hypothetical protein